MELGLVFKMLYNTIMIFLKKNLNKLVLLFYILVMTPVFLVLANGETCPPGTICNPLAGNGVNTLPQLIQIILVGAIKIGTPIVALAIIYCGFLFVFARGNSEKLTKAKDALLYTLIGAAILLGAWAIATMIQVTIVGLGS